MTYNGILLEEAIPGYRTLSVDGRQFNEVDIEANDNPGDGADFISKRIPERKLTISFMLKQTEQLSLRQAQDKLLSVLNQDEPKQLILSDEPNVYFNAIFEKAKIDEEHDRIRSGELTFICHDPFKHAIEKKSFTAEKVDGILTATIENTGNVAVPIEYEITMNSDNGFIGIVSKNGVMQYGFVEEADGHEYTRSERLMTIDTVYAAADDAAGAACYIQPDFNVSGTLAKTSSQVESRYWLYPKVIGSGSVWHGGQRTIEIPSDSNGEKGCQNFYLYMRHWFENWKLNELGYQSVSILDSDSKVICGIQIYKCAPGASKTYYNFVANNKIQKQKTFQADPSAANCFRANNGNNCIRKEGSQLIFYFFGYHSFVVPEVEISVAKKVQITMGGFGTYAGMTRNYLSAFDLDKLNVEKYLDDPNRYSNGDSMAIDGNTGKVYVNGLARMDENTGTVYFRADPGISKVEFYKSTWAQDITAKATIREAWL